MLGIDIISLMGSETSGSIGGIFLYDDTITDIEFGGVPAEASWQLTGDTVIGEIDGSHLNYVWLPSGSAADYEVVIVGSGFSSGAAGTYSCDTGVALSVIRVLKGSKSAHFTAAIQAKSNRGVYLTTASITITASVNNYESP